MEPDRWGGYPDNHICTPQDMNIPPKYVLSKSDKRVADRGVEALQAWLAKCNRLVTFGHARILLRDADDAND